MLVLARRVGERLLIGDDILIEIVEIGRGKVRVGILAPSQVPVMRTELLPPEQVPVPRAVLPADRRKPVALTPHTPKIKEQP